MHPTSERRFILDIPVPPLPVARCLPPLCLLLVGLLALLGCGRTAPVGVSAPPHAHATASIATPTALATLPPINSVTIIDYTASTSTPAAMCGYPLVAVATVSGFAAAHWNTATGERPGTVTGPGALESGGYEIYTPVRFSQFASLIDRRAVSAATNEYAMQGGGVGADSQQFEPGPNFQPGGRYVIVFSDAIVPGAHAMHTQRTMLALEAYAIDRQDVVTLQQASSGDSQGNPPVQAITIALSDLAGQLAQCR